MFSSVEKLNEDEKRKISFSDTTGACENETAI